MADPATTTNFLTAASIGTFAGATIAVWAVTNTLRRAFNIERAYIPLVVALLVSIGLAIQSGMYKSFLGILLTILNACLLFLSAAGMQQAGDIEFRGTEGASRQGKKRVGWFTPWFKSRRHTPAAVPEAAA